VLGHVRGVDHLWLHLVEEPQFVQDLLSRDPVGSSLGVTIGDLLYLVLGQVLEGADGQGGVRGTASTISLLAKVLTDPTSAKPPSTRALTCFMAAEANTSDGCARFDLFLESPRGIGS